jgi:sulfatase maturation enzyme AslB (radical SAM superfamily)
MLTNRCNLRCSYCVLEDAPHQLKAELDLEGKKELISHLYNKLNFRRLTLSGGEVTIIGKHPPKDFIELLRHIRNFRSDKKDKNLEIEVYTNARRLNEDILKEMSGVVDIVAITIDSKEDVFLSEIGRNYGSLSNYFEHVVQICQFITKYNIKLKLHSVVFQKNYTNLLNEIPLILNAIGKAGGKIFHWKFFQYMSYDVPEKDNIHSIPIDLFIEFKNKASEILKQYEVELHFKDIKEMRDSIFNILSYGNAQYMRAGDSWSTSQRTADLRTYNSMTDFFAKNNIDEQLFRKFNEISR